VTKGSFDIINAIGYGYMKVWDSRAYLARLTIAPIIIKFLCTMAVFSLNMEDNHLRAALILLPAFFAEGWMLSHFIRWQFLGQTWPFKPSGDDDKDMAELDERARGVLSGTISFVLLQMAIAAIWAYVLSFPMDEEALQNPGTELRVFSILFFVFMIWGFRYIWVFIAMAVNYGLLDYIKAVSNPRLSFYMIGTWLIAVVPGYMVMLGVTLPVLFAEGGDTSVFARFLAVGAHVVIEVVISLLAASCIAFGLKEIITKEGNESSE